MESELFSPSSGGWSWEGPGRSQGREVTSEAQKGRKVGFVPHAVKQRAEFVHLNCLSMKAWETASAAELLTSAAPVSTCARRSAPRLLLNPPLLHAGLSLPVLCRLLQTCCHSAVGGWLLSSSRHIPLMEGLRYMDLVKFSASEKEMPCFTSAHRRSSSASIFLVRRCYQMASCVPPSTAALAV